MFDNDDTRQRGRTGSTEAHHSRAVLTKSGTRLISCATSHWAQLLRPPHGRKVNSISLDDGATQIRTDENSYRMDDRYRGLL
jgi:hypothetical protein